MRLVQCDWSHRNSSFVISSMQDFVVSRAIQKWSPAFFKSRTHWRKFPSSWSAKSLKYTPIKDVTKPRIERYVRRTLYTYDLSRTSLLWLGWVLVQASRSATTFHATHNNRLQAKVVKCDCDIGGLTSSRRNPTITLSLLTRAWYTLLEFRM